MTKNIYKNSVIDIGKSIYNIEIPSFIIITHKITNMKI